MANGRKSRKMVLPDGNTDKPNTLVKSGAYLPEIGGSHFISVAAENITLTDELAHNIGQKQVVFLAGLQSVRNDDAAVVTVTLYDGDPSGSDFDIMFEIEVAAAGAGDRGSVNLGGAWHVARRGLWVKATGTTPNVLVMLNLIY